MAPQEEWGGVESRIIIILPYYGKFPGTMDLWLQTASYNKTIDFCIITEGIDCVLPENVSVYSMSFETFRERVQEKFDFKIRMDHPGKMANFRPALAYVFPELVESYDFWGFTECDLLLGNIRKFFPEEILARSDMCMRFGHFQLYRNCKKMNELFLSKTPANAIHYDFAFKNPEIVYFEENMGISYLAKANGCNLYAPDIMVDIDRFHFDFKRSWLINGKFYASDYDENGVCIWKSGDMKYIYLDRKGELLCEDVLYAHFQKRSLKIAARYPEAGFIVYPNRVADYREVTGDTLKHLYETRNSEEKQRFCRSIRRKQTERARAILGSLHGWKYLLKKFDILYVHKQTW